MLKSYVVCDCCGKTLEDTGVKFIQPVAIAPVTINGPTSRRIDVIGVDFCSVKCIQSALSKAFTQL